MGAGWAQDAEEAMTAMRDDDERRGDDMLTCDYCGRPLGSAEPRTEVGSAVFHRQPNCLLRKLGAITAH